MTPSQEFLRELKRALPIGRRRRVLAELRQHIEADVQAELARGLSAEDAEALVVSRLGAPGPLAAGMPPASRRYLVVAVLVVAMCAGLLALFSLRSTHHAPPNGRPLTNVALLHYPPLEVRFRHVVMHGTGSGLVYLLPVVVAKSYVPRNS